MSRKDDPFDTLETLLDQVINDPELKEDDIPTIQQIMNTLEEVAERNPMVGFAA